MVWVTVFWTEGFAPKTGLSPTIDIYRLSDDVKVVNASAMSEVGGGYYKYDFSTYDDAEQYVMVADGTATLDNTERYKFGGTENADNKAIFVETSQIADTVWDESLTGATHNVPTSSGRRLRQLETGQIIRTGTAQGGSLSTITLDAGADANNDFYRHCLCVIVVGSGLGQARRIDNYDGTTKIATTILDWVVAPDNTSEFEIVVDDAQHVTHIHDGGLAEIADAVWDEPASGHTASGTFGDKILRNETNVSGITDELTRLLGLTHENIWQTHTWNGQNHVSSAIELYNSKAAANLHDGSSGIVATYSLNISYANDKPISHKMVRDS